MSEGVIITIEMVIKPELAEQVIAGIPALCKDTVSRPGFRKIRVVQNKDEPNRVLIMEHWDREEDYQAYQAWRRETSDMGAAMANLLSYKSDVWPGLVGAAVAAA
jgi:quinol monooxygenase YgiN